MKGYYSDNDLQCQTDYLEFLICVFIMQGKVKDIELKGHTDSVDQLCWDPRHADIVATAAGDKTVRLWDARSK